MKKNIFLIFVLIIFTIQSLFSGFKDEINKGNKFYFKQKYDESLKKYNEAELTNPNSAIVHFNAGDVFYRQGNYEDAIKRYQKALNLAKDKNFKSNILYNLGNANYKLQNFDQAKEYYKQSLILNPKNSLAKYNLQQLLFVPKLQNEKSKNKEKEDKSKQQNSQDKTQQQNDKTQSSQQQKNKSMSKQDVERLIEMSQQQNQNKDKQTILKPQKPKLPEVEYDW